MCLTLFFQHLTHSQFPAELASRRKLEWAVLFRLPIEMRDLRFFLQKRVLVAALPPRDQHRISHFEGEMIPVLASRGQAPCWDGRSFSDSQHRLPPARSVTTSNKSLFVAVEFE